MYQPQDNVAVFMKAGEQDVLETPTIPHDDVLHLRCKLNLEETFEFLEAAGYAIVVGDVMIKDRNMLGIVKVGPANLSEMAKELVDINVVTYGAGNAIGVNLQEVWDEVHRSNMSKIPPDGKIIKNSYGKVQKPASYSPADIDTVLKKQGWEQSVNG